MFVLMTSFQISSMLAEPANSTSDALLLSIGLESEGLVHYVVRKADEETVNRDNIVVKKGTLEINGTSPSPPSHGAIRTAGVGMVQSNPRGDLFVAETVDGLEPNVMYEVRKFKTYRGRDESSLCSKS